MEKFHRNACKLSMYLFVKTRMGHKVMLRTIDHVSLATIISKLFEHYILSCISLLVATTDNQFSLPSKQNIALTCVVFY